VNQFNTYLARQDNYRYYSGLTQAERSFINRYIVKSYFNTFLNTDNIDIVGKDKIFFDRLSESQKRSIDKIKNQRRADVDIFAENPVLIADKAWIMLDSLQADAGNYTITGQLINKITGQSAYSVQVMITAENDVIGIISTDSTGHFSLDSLSQTKNYFVFIERKNSDLELRDLAVKYHGLMPDTSLVVAHTTKSVPDSSAFLILYFDFDSFILNKKSVAQLNEWIRSNQPGNNATIQISGHTDSKGREEYNRLLGKKRANSVGSYLIKLGFDKKIIYVNSYGGAKPRYYGKQDPLNRRTELTVFK
jgi:outer membrane protein OmpA-like peptidoglycan-associated protein